MLDASNGLRQQQHDRLSLPKIPSKLRRPVFRASRWIGQSILSEAGASGRAPRTAMMWVDLLPENGLWVVRGVFGVGQRVIVFDPKIRAEIVDEG